MATEIEPTDITLPEPEKMPEVEVSLEPKDAKEPKIIEPEVGLEKLKKQLEDEKTARQAAQARARTAEQEAQAARAAEAAAKTESADNRLHLVTTAIASVTQSIDMAESEYAKALADGDHTRAAKINREMVVNGAKLEGLERAKQNLEQAPKVQPKAVKTDPVEKFASQLSARSADWIRAHPDFAKDPRLNRKMIRAHEDAIDDGITPDTDAYFEAIETKLNLRTPDISRVDDADTAPQKATGGRSTAPAAAPVSRSGSGNGSKPRSIRLTPEMREAAKASGMTDQEYAIEYQKLRDEGVIH